MIQVAAHDCPPALRALFDPAEPAGLRCFAVLNGCAAGQIWTDDLARPTWGVVLESGFRTVYLGGAFDAQTLAEIFSALRQAGEMLIGLPLGNTRFAMLPAGPYYDGRVLEFTDRQPGDGLAAYMKIPEGCELRPVDPELFTRCQERDLLTAIYGSAEEALAHGFGLCLMRGNQILSEAHAGPAALGLIELGVMTPERHRHRGYATLTCAHLIQECERRSYQTYWNCDKYNHASVALAGKLGYRKMQEYRLLAWTGTG